MTTTLPGPVVDAAWLTDHLDAVVVCDTRWYLDEDADVHLAAFATPDAGPVELTVRSNLAELRFETLVREAGEIVSR